MKKIFCICLIIVVLFGCRREEIYLPLNFEEETSAGVSAIFPDLSYGFSMALESDNGETVLVGCAHGRDFADLYAFMRQRHVTDLDALILMSDKELHEGSFEKLISNFVVDKVYICDVKNLDSYRSLCMSNSRTGTEVVPVCTGMTIYNGGNVKIDVVFSGYCIMDGKEHAVMSLRADCYGTGIFVEGNGVISTELDIISSDTAIDSDVFVIPHSGAMPMPGGDLLDKVNPRYAVLPVYPDCYPARSTMKLLKDRDMEIIRTDREGTIVFTMDKDGVSYNVIR